MTPSDSKVLMLKRVTRRLRRQLQNEQQALAKLDKLFIISQEAVIKLREQIRSLRSGGALATAAIPPELEYAYNEGVKIVTEGALGPFQDGQHVYVYNAIKPTSIIKWIVRNYGGDVYDLEYEATLPTSK